MYGGQKREIGRKNRWFREAFHIGHVKAFKVQYTLLQLRRTRDLRFDAQAVAADRESVSESVLDKTYMGQLVAVQHRYYMDSG